MFLKTSQIKIHKRKSTSLDIDHCSFTFRLILLLNFWRLHMSKNTTNYIQNQLKELGNLLGFKSLIEYSFKENSSLYAPRYDVVWLLDVSILKIQESLDLKLIENKFLPFVAFEIEGSTTSSKNQLGNIGNLRLSPCHYNFLIVNNDAAGKENDTYRRAIKLMRTTQELMGNRTIFLLDSSMLNDSTAIISSKTSIHSIKKSIPRIKGSGGEKQSLEVAKDLLKILDKSSLQVELDQSPAYHKYAYHNLKNDSIDRHFTHNPITFEQKQIKRSSQYYYIPKVDIMAGFSLRGGFVDFLIYCGTKLKTDVVNYPLLQYLVDFPNSEMYHPLLGIEIETKESKHALGSMLNLHHYFQFGWLVSNEQMKSYTELYQHHFGMRNINFINAEELRR